jgi:hypothetical protein
MRGMDNRQNDSLASMIERRRQILALLVQKESIDQDASVLLAELAELIPKILPHILPSKESMETIALAERLKAHRAEML